VYVNAYAFPGGSIAITRGMLLAMNSEAELAAVMGHEIGHVCSRHTAQSMTQGYMCQGGLILTGLIVNTATNGKYKDWVDMGSGLGSIGAGALLARYSRAHEREADGLSLKYMTAGGYNPQGAVDLMDLLRKLSKSNPNVIEMLFATHPMSEERYQTMLQESRSTYAQHSALPLHREIYLDRTASLRAMKGAIEKMQKGEEALADKKLNDADTFLTSALKLAPDDYAGLLLMARLRLAQKKWAEAERLAGDARAVYPREPQSYYLSGMAKVKAKRFDPAYKDFGDYERMLPGNPNTIFYLGYCEEGLGRREAAANHYKTYVENSNETEEHKYAYQRLLEWGYIQPPAAQGQKSS